MWGKLGWLNWFWQFLCEVLSSFNPKWFYYSHAWSCSLCERRTYFCMGLISRKLLLMFLTSFTSVSVLLLFPLLITFFVLVHGFLFYFIKHRWSSPDQTICYCICLWRLFIRHKDWLAYSGGTDRPGELCYNFSISTQMVNFPIWIPGWLTVLLVLLYSFLLMLVFVLQWLSLFGKVWSCLSFRWLSNELKTDAPFHHIAYDHSCPDWDSLWDHLRDVPWEDIFKPSASAAASEFCEWF